jgi:hypothetical protein
MGAAEGSLELRLIAVASTRPVRCRYCAPRQTLRRHIGIRIHRFEWWRCLLPLPQIVVRPRTSSIRDELLQFPRAGMRNYCKLTHL